MQLKIKVSEIQFVQDLYPREGFDNETVNAYRTNLERLPAIIVTHEKVLVDGYHRLLAHKLEGLTEIEAEVREIPRERVLWEATRLNAQHGRQLMKEEKQKLARIFYKDNGCKLSEISEVLAVSESALSNWLSDLIKATREEQKKQIVDLYLQCLTQEEIADKTSLSRSRIAEIVGKFKTEFSDTVPESHQLYNVWNFAKRDTRYGLDFEGAIPGQIVENLLHYFTEPFDLVVDPMAGGGTTVDVCKVMFRRYQAYDLNPMREDITKNNIREGYPKDCKNIDFVFLDPPYFNMVFKDLFKDIYDFYDFLSELAKNTYDVLRQDGIVAIIMQDMTELGNYCLSGSTFCIFESNGFQPIAHISCPLGTQQFLPQQVEKVKEEKRMLGRNRDIYVFRKVKHG